MKRTEIKTGQKVKHKFRKTKYQNCKVVEIESGCNGRIKIICDNVESYFCIQDLELIK